MSDREGYLQRRDRLLMQDEEIAELKAEVAELRAQAVWAEQVMRNYDCHDEFCDGLAALLPEKGE